MFCWKCEVVTDFNTNSHVSQRKCWHQQEQSLFCLWEKYKIRIPFCVYFTCVQVPAEAKEGIRSSAAGVSGCSKLLHVGTGNHTCVFWKISKHSYPLSHLSSLLNYKSYFLFVDRFFGLHLLFSDLILFPNDKKARQIWGSLKANQKGPV